MNKYFNYLLIAVGVGLTRIQMTAEQNEPIKDLILDFIWHYFEGIKAINREIMLPYIV